MELPPVMTMTMTMTMTMLDQAAVTADPGRVDEGRGPDPEVLERARRRTFTAAYKAQILAAYEGAGQGEKGALLRRECLYSSTPATSWTGGGPGMLRRRSGPLLRGVARDLIRRTRRSRG
jgi:transposase